MDLRRHFLRPARAELRGRNARVEEERSLRSGPGLGQLLGRQHPEREARIHDLGGEVLGRADTALYHLVEPDLLCIADTVFAGDEGTAIEEIGCMHLMPASGSTPANSWTPAVSPSA